MKIIGHKEDWQAIKEHCLRLKDHATNERTIAGRGRLQFWLNAEPDYRTGKYWQGTQDSYLWQICKQLMPSADLAQIYFADGNKGIDWHRDGSYSTPDAIILNLGNAILESKSYKGVITSLKLTGGEVISFNAKQLHRGIPLDDQRIGIGIWQARIPIAGNLWED